MKSRSRTFALLLAAMVATACGPTLPLDIGVRDAGANIFFGRPAPSPAPIPVQQVPFLGFPMIEVPPPFTLPPPAINKCPTASPLAFPKMGATVIPTKPPVPSTYEYRYQGQLTVPTVLFALRQNIFAYGTRQVTNVQVSSDGHYTFDVVEKFAKLTQTNSYAVFPQSVLGPSPVLGVGPDAGIYLTEMQLAPIGLTFRPATPIQLMTLPASMGPMTLRGTGSDGQTTIQITPNQSVSSQPPDTTNSYDAGQTTVDACGTPLRAWKILLTGTIGSASPNTATTAGTPEETFSLELDFGTQYGALSLRDAIAVNWTNQSTGTPGSYTMTTTIDQEPQLPK